MIIPVLCFTCGKTLADKYDYYLREVEKLEKTGAMSGPVAAALAAGPSTSNAPPAPTVPLLGPEARHFDTLRTGPILDRLGLTRICCRRHMLTTVDMMDII
jgi:DNA-directed RNA polymerase I, II, and III subunit RPABC5